MVFKLIELQTRKACKHDSDKTDFLKFGIMQREKLKQNIFICGHAVDTVFEIGFSATHKNIQKWKLFLMFNFNCEFSRVRNDIR